MITSKRLTPERLEAIRNSPVYYDEDSPKLTREQILRMKPRNPEAFARQQALDRQAAAETPLTVTLNAETARVLHNRAQATKRTIAQIIDDMVQRELVTEPAAALA